MSSPVPLRRRLVAARRLGLGAGPAVAESPSPSRRAPVAALGCTTMIARTGCAIYGAPHNLHHLDCLTHRRLHYM
eukprot:5912377-Pyramimonas_sp.AAC.1